MKPLEGSSGLIVPSSLRHLNVVKQDPMKRLRHYLEALDEADPHKGRQRAVALYNRIGDLITKSFAKDVLPVNGTPTRNMIDERLDKCVELVLALADKGWVSTRIIDELKRIFFDELVKGETKIPERSSWGVQENNPVSLDFTEDESDV